MSAGALGGRLCSPSRFAQGLHFKLIKLSGAEHTEMKANVRGAILAGIKYGAAVAVFLIVAVGR